MKQREVLFEAKGITKKFGTTVALDHVDLTIYRGEIRGLIGENGSGKSTISSIAAGMFEPNEGSMTFNGKPHSPATMLEGAAAGFGMIVQEMGTVSGLTVAQNIFLGNEKQFRGRTGLISKAKMNAAAQKALDGIGFRDVAPDQYIDSLDMQDRKLVEVAKVMYGNPDVMVVDETTTALSQKGRQIIYDLMEKQKAEGKSVMFISHDLEEVMEHCDSLTVLRDGKLIATLDKENFEPDLIKKYMVGREVSSHYYREDLTCSFDSQVVLKIRDLTTGRGELTNFSADLHRGEILGIGGLSSCGMHELGRAVFGEEPIVTGSVVHVPSGEVIDKARTAIRHGTGYVSKNRDQEALVLSASIKDNIVGAAYDKVSRKGLIFGKEEKVYVQKVIDALRIKCSDMDEDVKSLSGGNKQKVSFGKWIGRHSDILILDCPTRGVDIGVKASMYQLMEEMKKQGQSILMISEEMTELIGMCDRIIVLRNGRISGQMTRGKDMNENTFINLMI